MMAWDSVNVGVVMQTTCPPIPMATFNLEWIPVFVCVDFCSNGTMLHDAQHTHHARGALDMTVL